MKKTSSKNPLNYSGIAKGRQYKFHKPRGIGPVEFMLIFALALMLAVAILGNLPW